MSYKPLACTCQEQEFPRFPQTWDSGLNGKLSAPRAPNHVFFSAYIITSWLWILQIAVFTIPHKSQTNLKYMDRKQPAKTLSPSWHPLIPQPLLNRLFPPKSPIYLPLPFSLFSLLFLQPFRISFFLSISFAFYLTHSHTCEFFISSQWPPNSMLKKQKT